jgi:hypothetical protein
VGRERETRWHGGAEGGSLSARCCHRLTSVAFLTLFERWARAEHGTIHPIKATNRPHHWAESGTRTRRQDPRLVRLRAMFGSYKGHPAVALLLFSFQMEPLRQRGDSVLVVSDRACCSMELP